MTISSLRHSFLLIFFLAASCVFTAVGRPQQPLKGNERERVLAEMRAYKHDVLVKALSLTSDQQREFFPVYDEMDEKLMQINTEARDLEKRVLADEQASDTEIGAAASAVFSQKEREGKIEMEYFEKFKEILTPRQLLGLKKEEKLFTQKLVRQHRRIKDSK